MRLFSMFSIWDDLKNSLLKILMVWFFCLAVDQLYDLATYGAIDRYPNPIMFFVHSFAMLVRGIILYLWFNIVKWHRWSWTINPVSIISMMWLISIFHFSFIFNPKFPLHNIPKFTIGISTLWTALKESSSWKSTLEKTLKCIVSYLHHDVPLPSYEPAPCTHVITGAVSVLLRMGDRLVAICGGKLFTEHFIHTCSSGIVSSASDTPNTGGIMLSWEGVRNGLIDETFSAMFGSDEVKNSNRCVQTNLLEITSFENYTLQILVLHLVAYGVCFYYYPTRLTKIPPYPELMPYDNTNARELSKRLFPDELRKQVADKLRKQIPVTENGPDMAVPSRARNVLHARGRSPGTLPARGRSPGTQV